MRSSHDIPCLRPGKWLDCGLQPGQRPGAGLSVVILTNPSRCTTPPLPQKLFTPKALSFYNGEKGAPLYIAILGEVYDVTAGRKHYGMLWAGKGLTPST